MRYIVMALFEEAKPLIQTLKLNALSQKPFKIYANNNYTLIISGIGNDAVLMAVSHLLTRFSFEKNDLLINYGIAAARKDTPLGSLFLASKISSYHSKFAYYPQMLIRHDFAERPLMMVDAPLTHPEVEACDMESFAFFKAGLNFIKLSQLIVAKVVSDHFEPDRLPDIKKLQEDLNQNFLSLVPYFEALEQELKNKLDFSENLNRAYQRIVENLKLTKSQQDQLESALYYFILRHDAEPLLPQPLASLHKKEQKDAFASLIAQLRA